MAEAERLSVEKRSIELEKGKVQIEINYRENVVADKQRIADSSDLKRIGSAGVSQTRTYWDLCLTLGIPFSRWGAMPFILCPFPFPQEVPVTAQVTETAESVSVPIHPVQLALRWQQEIESDPKVTKARIAAREGLSRARVTQIMNLLRLPAAIQNYLLDPPAPLNIGAFSERRLRELLRENNLIAQMDSWRMWLQDLSNGRQN